MNDRNDRAQDRAIQRLLTRQAELKVIEKWTQEAKAWYNETIWGEEERLRMRSEERQKETMKRSELNNKVMLETQNWIKWIGKETSDKKADRETIDTSSNEEEKEDLEQGGNRKYIIGDS